MFVGIDTYGGTDGNQNGTVDWSKAKAAGIGYAIIRAAYGTTPDKGFIKNWPLMAKAGVVRGGYLFLRFPCKSKGITSVPTPTEQAEAVCKIVGVLSGVDYPISLDVEFPGEGQPDTGMTKKQLLNGVLEAWNVLKAKYGVAPIIYSSARVWYDDLGNPDVPAEVKESLLWLARYAFDPGTAVLTNIDAIAYPPVPPPWAGTDPKPVIYRGMPYSNDNWFIHQYQGDAKGPSIIPLGFPKGDIDLNRMRSIQKGSTGEKVKWVQRRLGFIGANVDGKFGPMTDTAVRKLQASKNDVVVDGIVGPRTMAYLCWMNP